MGFIAQAAAFGCRTVKQEENKIKTKWDGSNANLGVNRTTGNSPTKNYNIAFNLKYVNQPWLNTFETSAQFGETDDIMTKRIYFIQDQINYSLSKDDKVKNFIFASGNSKFDTFSPYTYQSVVAVGYGHDWFRNENVVFSTQLGPGARQNKERETSIITTSLIATLQTDLTWKITPNLSFSQMLRDDYGKQYNLLRSESAMTNKILGNCAIQLKYVVENYSRIPALTKRTKKTDTTLIINLVYNF